MTNLSIVQEVKAVEIKTVEGLDYTYVVTTEGDIYKQPTGKQLKVTHHEDAIAPYTYVRLSVNGKYEKHSVSQLVLDNFVGITLDDDILGYADNINGDYTDCKLSNLQYNSFSNIRDRQLRTANEKNREGIIQLIESKGLTLKQLSLGTTISSDWLEKWLNEEILFGANNIETMQLFIEMINMDFYDTDSLGDDEMVKLACNHMSGIIKK